MSYLVFFDVSYVRNTFLIFPYCKHTTNSTTLSSKVNSFLTDKKFNVTEPTVSPSQTCH
jgi:hypothetical protein